MLQMICISNISDVEFHSNGKALYDDRTPVTFDWLKPGTIYDIENMIGKVFIDMDTNELIDAVILKDSQDNVGISKLGWIPANLFMKVEDWREQQLNKIL
jgi:hypothetical protein